MQQIYHSNAKTNVYIREQIQNNCSLSVKELAQKYSISVQTASKWKNRNAVQDASSAPNKITYALSEMEKTLIVSVRRSTWLPIDEIWEMLLETNPNMSRSSVYRCLVKEKINKVPQAKRDVAKKFKEYKPGYLHMDVTYLPKFNGCSSYLFVAIDRATRVLFYWVYQNKTAENTEDFMDKCLEFYPFKITHILTDNGLEFTNRLIKSKKGNLCQKPSKMDVKCVENQIEHRLTKPSTPQTNGMVERVNGTIKNNTILKTSYSDKQEMNTDLIRFMCYYNLYRRHGSLRKEIKVKTPIQAIQKWYEIEPQIFIITPRVFQDKLLNLRSRVDQLSSTTL